MTLRTVAFSRDRRDLEKLRAAIARGAPSADVPLAEMRARFDRLASSMPVGAGIEHEAVTTGDRPAEWSRTAGSRADGAILHLHGGGYVLGSSLTTRTVTAGLTRHTGLPVLALDYRLAPEHPFPAAIEDAVEAYSRLIDRGLAPGRIVVSGDSAGGGLAMALLLTLRDRALPLPAGAVGISPMLDLTLSSPSIEANLATDPQVSREFLQYAVGRYLAAGIDPKAPLASPVFADLTGLPPVLLQAGGDEALLDDSLRFADAAEAVGVDVTVECWEAMMHVWHAFAPRFPEAEAALAAIAAWVHLRLGAR
jgi:acetyl esterase/lipase